MKEKYPNDSKVFSYYFDIQTSELKCDELVVYNYKYMDDMQWNVIDEYMCYREYYEKKWWFLKKKKRISIRLPGFLISGDKFVAKIKLLRHTLESFGYILKGDTGYEPEPSLKNIVKLSQRCMNDIIEKYPEMCLKAIDDIKPEDGNFSIWR